MAKGWKHIPVQAILVLTAILIISGAGLFLQFNDHTYTATVTDKDRIFLNSDDGAASAYVVYTKDANGNVRVFRNSDSLFRWKWTSSDMQGYIEVGETYTFTVTGCRIPILSAYENIIKVEPADDGEFRTK
jgi:hypothetical protein